MPTAARGGIVPPHSGCVALRDQGPAKNHAHPVEGGSCSAYDYTCGDPVNGMDLSGLKSWWKNKWVLGGVAAVAVAGAVACYASVACGVAVTGALSSVAASSAALDAETGGGVAAEDAAASTAVQDTAAMAEDWPGPNTRAITNSAGDKVYLSEDGLWRIRFDINNPYPHDFPHAHVEEFVNGKWVKSGPIWPTDVPHR